MRQHKKCFTKGKQHLRLIKDSHLHITLSSNARRVPFEYPYMYLNKKEKVCKARVNEWITNQI